MTEYFVLVHGHLCDSACPSGGACPSAHALLTQISEIEEDDPFPLFERIESEGLQNAYVLRTSVKALFERPSFKGQPRLRQDCIGAPHKLIHVITRSGWNALVESAAATIPPDRVHFEYEMPGSLLRVPPHQPNCGW